MTTETTHSNEADDGNESAEDHVRIFDTTLRDGEQAPGFSMDRRAKLCMAQALETLGVDILEAGFPQASPDDFAAVDEIARTLRNTAVCALARCQTGDIDTAARALEGARHSRIHLFLSTSPLHREHKLGMSRQQVLETAIASIEHARRYCADIEFSAEDALRTEPEFLVEIFSAAIAAGATTLNAPDTVGYTTPAEMVELFTYLRRNVRDAHKAVFSAHCHDDLGMAVANSLAAVSAGARQVECTINGIGERAGNAALEEIVMALKVRAPHFNLQTRIDTRKLYPTSRLLTQLTGQAVPRNKAVVGENAFAHESGIHQHGMLKHRSTYEIMRPQDVGIAETTLVLGKHSGRHALRQRLETLGHMVDEVAMDGIFKRFKALADRKRDIRDEDLEAIALGQDPDATGPWHLTQLNTSSHLGGSASATVKLSHENGREIGEAAIGDGPVDAVLRAIERATGTDMQLTRFQVRAISEGGDAQGHAQLTARHAQRDWNGSSVSTDIIEATAHAALAIVNRIERQGGERAAYAPTKALGHGRPPSDLRAQGRTQPETSA
ncbi:2-isopropylmalate synthase [Dyella flava]|uniref:2-isopropylmalate synthase n=1 Tax=Dyella flava TaxID=1920170 RepID=A0ABS2K2Y7_9GAMM|nr:2-isopropylmalate synthase [Dyella flava]MBM7125601.1 2-isopropylmalate synthase [Dyella flava]GLQ51537.1 2-isopropylmalate synthase [Dyella flava]